MNSIGFYVSSIVSDEMQERYGSCLKEMAFGSLLAFHAVTSTYTLYCSFEGNSDNSKLTFGTVVKTVVPDWKDKDAEAYEYCKRFCTESCDGKPVFLSNLVPMCKALAEAIQCHDDY